MLSLFEILVY